MLLVGIASAWRKFLRPEHLTLFVMSAALLVIARIRYWAAGLDLRYFMPIVLLGLPWMAIGVERVIAAGQWLDRRVKLTFGPRFATAGVCAAILLCSFLDAPMAATARMERHATLGRWIRDRAGPEPTIVGNIDYLSLDAFYADGRVLDIVLPGQKLQVPLPRALTQQQADAVVLWNNDASKPERLSEVERQIAPCGYSRVDAKLLPAPENELMVMMKTTYFR